MRSETRVCTRELAIFFFIGIFVSIVLLPVIAVAQTSLTYTVEYSLTKSDKIHVTIETKDPAKGPVTLVIPRAIPSGYGAQFYDRYVENVSGQTATGKSLKVVREEGPRWRIGDTGDDAAARVEYDVDIRKQELEITSAADASKVRKDYLGVLGYSSLGYIEGSESIPVSLRIRGPKEWPVYSTLSPKFPADKAAATATADSFFALADSQIIMGTGIDIRRVGGKVPVYLVVYAETETDLNKHAEVLADAFGRVYEYFGNAPFGHFTAHIEFMKPVSERHEYGFSMEHLESSTFFLGVDRAYNDKTKPIAYFRDNANFVHHITHSWIPKVVYGTSYLPFTWELPPIIDTIWFNEGFARFITIELIAESRGVKEARRYRDDIYDRYRNEIDGMPEFIKSMPLLELSRIGSTMYSSDFRTGRTLFMKGALMAEEMDVLIRRETGGRKRLRDSLRHMVEWGRKNKRPFRISELPDLIANPAGVERAKISEIMERWLARREL